MKAQMWNKTEWVNITDSEYLRSTLSDILEKAGFKILNIHDHYFTPYGYTALWLLSESHLAVHTFPEENKTYIELSSCVKKQYELFDKIFNEKFSTNIVK